MASNSILRDTSSIDPEYDSDKWIKETIEHLKQKLQKFQEIPLKNIRGHLQQCPEETRFKLKHVEDLRQFFNENKNTFKVSDDDIVCLRDDYTMVEDLQDKKETTTNTEWQQEALSFLGCMMQNPKKISLDESMILIKKAPLLVRSNIHNKEDLKEFLKTFPKVFTLVDDGYVVIRGNCLSNDIGLLLPPMKEGCDINECADNEESPRGQKDLTADPFAKRTCMQKNTWQYKTIKSISIKLLFHKEINLRDIHSHLYDLHESIKSQLKGIEAQRNFLLSLPQFFYLNNLDRVKLVPDFYIELYSAQNIKFGLARVIHLNKNYGFATDVRTNHNVMFRRMLIDATWISNEKNLVDEFQTDDYIEYEAFEKADTEPKTLLATHVTKLSGIEVKAVDHISSILKRVKTISIQNLTGYLSQAPHNIRSLILPKTTLHLFLKRHHLVFQVDEVQLTVQIRCESVSLKSEVDMKLCADKNNSSTKCDNPKHIAAASNILPLTKGKSLSMSNLNASSNMSESLSKLQEEYAVKFVVKKIEKYNIINIRDFHSHLFDCKQDIAQLLKYKDYLYLFIRQHKDVFHLNNSGDITMNKNICSLIENNESKSSLFNALETTSQKEASAIKYVVTVYKRETGIMKKIVTKLDYFALKYIQERFVARENKIKLNCLFGHFLQADIETKQHCGVQSKATEFVARLSDIFTVSHGSVSMAPVSFRMWTSTGDASDSNKSLQFQEESSTCSYSCTFDETTSGLIYSDDPTSLESVSLSRRTSTASSSKSMEYQDIVYVRTKEGSVEKIHVSYLDYIALKFIHKQFQARNDKILEKNLFGHFGDADSQLSQYGSPSNTQDFVERFPAIFIRSNGYLSMTPLSFQNPDNNDTMCMNNSKVSTKQKDVSATLSIKSSSPLKTTVSPISSATALSSAVTAITAISGTSKLVQSGSVQTLHSFVLAGKPLQLNSKTEVSSQSVETKATAPLSNTLNASSQPIPSCSANSESLSDPKAISDESVSLSLRASKTSTSDKSSPSSSSNSIPLPSDCRKAIPSCSADSVPASFAKAISGNSVTLSSNTGETSTSVKSSSLSSSYSRPLASAPSKAISSCSADSVPASVVKAISGNSVTSSSNTGETSTSVKSSPLSSSYLRPLPNAASKAISSCSADSVPASVAKAISGCSATLLSNTGNTSISSTKKSEPPSSSILMPSTDAIDKLVSSSLVSSSAATSHTLPVNKPVSSFAVRSLPSTSSMTFTPSGTAQTTKFPNNSDSLISTKVVPSTSTNDEQEPPNLSSLLPQLTASRCCVSDKPMQTDIATGHLTVERRSVSLSTFSGSSPEVASSSKQMLSSNSTVQESPITSVTQTLEKVEKNQTKFQETSTYIRRSESDDFDDISSSSSIIYDEKDVCENIEECIQRYSDKSSECYYNSGISKDNINSYFPPLTSEVPKKQYGLGTIHVKQSCKVIRDSHSAEDIDVASNVKTSSNCVLCQGDLVEYEVCVDEMSSKKIAEKVMKVLDDESNIVKYFYDYLSTVQSVEVNEMLNSMLVTTEALRRNLEPEELLKRFLKRHELLFLVKDSTISLRSKRQDPIGIEGLKAKNTQDGMLPIKRLEKQFGSNAIEEPVTVSQCSPSAALGTNFDNTKNIMLPFEAFKNLEIAQPPYKDLTKSVAVGDVFIASIIRLSKRSDLNWIAVRIISKVRSSFSDQPNVLSSKSSEPPDSAFEHLSTPETTHARTQCNVSSINENMNAVSDQFLLKCQSIAVPIKSSVTGASASGQSTVQIDQQEGVQASSDQSTEINQLTQQNSPNVIGYDTIVEMQSGSISAILPPHVIIRMHNGETGVFSFSDSFEMDDNVFKVGVNVSYSAEKVNSHQMKWKIIKMRLQNYSTVVDSDFSLEKKHVHAQTVLTGCVIGMEYVDI